MYPRAPSRSTGFVVKAPAAKIVFSCCDGRLALAEGFASDAGAEAEVTLASLAGCGAGIEYLMSGSCDEVGEVTTGCSTAVSWVPVHEVV